MRFGPQEAADVRQITRSEIVLFSEALVAASSLARSELAPALARRYLELSIAHDNAMAAKSGIVLNGEHFLCLPGKFQSLSGDRRTSWVTCCFLRKNSRIARISKLHATEFAVRRSLLGIVLSTAIIWLVIRRTTRPLRLLRDSAEAVGRGDFSRRVEVESRDECGELAATFNQMTHDVKISRDKLEKTVETLKATQNQLIQSEKLSGIGEFVAGVAHELNNPLTSVIGFSELLQQSDMPESAAAYVISM